MVKVEFSWRYRDHCTFVRLDCRLRKSSEEKEPKTKQRIFKVEYLCLCRFGFKNHTNKLQSQVMWKNSMYDKFGGLKGYEISVLAIDDK